MSTAAGRSELLGVGTTLQLPSGYQVAVELSASLTFFSFHTRSRVALERSLAMLLARSSLALSFMPPPFFPDAY